MVFDVPTLIEFLSGSKTLLPGTVILDGNAPRSRLCAEAAGIHESGDTVSVEIEKIGTLTNPVVNEKVLRSGRTSRRLHIRHDFWPGCQRHAGL